MLFRSTTCYDAVSLDYKVVVLSDCCSSNTEEIQRANLLDMGNIGAKILSSDEFLPSLDDGRLSIRPAEMADLGRCAEPVFPRSRLPAGNPSGTACPSIPATSSSESWTGT